MAEPRQGVSQSSEGELEIYRAALLTEYGQWVATQTIFHDGVPAYNVGDPVPIENVKKFKYQEMGLVEAIKPEPKTATKKEGGVS